MKYRVLRLLQMIVSFFVLSIAAAVFMFAYRSYIKADQKVVRFDEQTVDAAYIGVLDIYGMEYAPDLHEFFLEPNSMERMDKFNEFLNSSYDYIVLQTQSLVTHGEMPYKDNFRSDYGQEYYGVNDQFGYYLKSVQLNQNAYNIWEITKMLDIGTGFDGNDFVQNKSEDVPVILGHEYKELVSVGDVYPIEYYGKNVNIKIIGFFRKDASIPFINDIYYLDECILFPSYRINYKAVNEDEDYIHKIISSQQNWGFISMNNGDNYFEYQKEIEEKSKELNLLYITNEAYAIDYIQEVSSTLNSGKGIFLWVSLLLFLILSIVMLYIFIWDYNKNKMDYAIYLACGSSLLQLKLKIYSKILLLFAAAFLCAGGINYSMLGYERLNRESVFLFGQTVKFSGVLTAIVVLFTCVVLNIYINRNNIYTDIQKGSD